LRILSGRHLTKPDGAVTVLGRSAFHDTTLNFDRSYLDTDWGMRTVAFAGYGKKCATPTDNYHSTSIECKDVCYSRTPVVELPHHILGCPLQADIPVHGMMQRLQEEYPQRRDELLRLLGEKISHDLFAFFIIFGSDS
jgi:hypothetical protein